VKWWSREFFGTAGLRFAGVGNRPLHEEPSGNVKERQAALFGSLAQEPHDLGHAFIAFAPIAAFGVHVAGALVAFAIAGCSYAKSTKQQLERSAGADPCRRAYTPEWKRVCNMAALAAGTTSRKITTIFFCNHDREQSTVP
jgi:hypothetical protein